MKIPVRARPCWGLSLLLALCVHGMLLAAGLWMHPPQPTPLAGNLQALMVELAMLPAAPQAPPSELPPAPPRQVPQAQPKPTPKLREPEPAPLPGPTPSDVEAPYREAQEDAVKPSVQAPQAAIAQTTTPPAMDASSDAGHAAVSGQARQQAVADWQGLLLGHLQRHRRYPRNAQRLRQQGVAHVRFSVDRQGRVGNPRIGRSSGHPLLDEETLATLLRASPVPPPPPEIRGDPVEVNIPVSFFIRR